MAKTITAANAVITLSVAGLFPVGQQLQGFAAEDVFDTEDLETGEVLMGVDGKLSAGIVYNPVRQSFTLQADSDSNDFFEALYSAERAARDKLFINGTTLLTSIAKQYVMTKGVLMNYKPITDAKRVLQPRKFTITWESVLPAAA